MAIHDPALLDALESLPPTRWHGRVWRHMFNNYTPDRVNTTGARWNPPGVGAIYTALDRDTALAEGQHAIDVQPRRTYAQRMLYELDVSVDGLVDLTGPDALSAIGITEEDIQDDDHTACQRIGGAVAWLERGGLLVPSARTSDSNLVILVGTRGLTEDLVVMSSQKIDS